MRHQPPLQQPEQGQSLHIRVENMNIEWWSYAHPIRLGLGCHIDQLPQQHLGEHDTNVNNSPASPDRGSLFREGELRTQP